jgi:hypothetical protein
MNTDKMKQAKLLFLLIARLYRYEIIRIVSDRKVE